MPSDTISVKMLGEFSIEWNGNTISDKNNRMRKVWLLLAYLIYNRTQQITQDHYISLLQSKSSDDSTDPGANLKAMFFRLRSMLDQLGESAGHTLILRQSGSYVWNPDILLTLDTEVFEQLCQAGNEASEPSEKLGHYLQALELYQGDFLPKLSAESWAMPLSAYYHQLYLDTTEKALALLETDARWSDIVHLCEHTLKIEAYQESIYQHLMRAQLALGESSEALHMYEEMSDLLFSTFGVMPSEESRALYRKAMRSENSYAIPAGEIRESLKELDAPKGALFCEYDFFKILYQAQARALVRSGDTIHIALFSIQGRGQKELSRRSLDRAAENLKELLISNLRQGDIITRCSSSQLLIMLPQANYENSCAVCERLLRAFNRQYPHTPADIKFCVQPLEPLEFTSR